MLDDLNVIRQKDPHDALSVAAGEVEQLGFQVVIENEDTIVSGIDTIVVAGMGGSALAAGIARSWLNTSIPFEVVKDYVLPAYVNEKTLVIASSYSGNTEETLAALSQAEEKNAKIAVITAGGKLAETAKAKHYPLTILPANVQPRMAVHYNLRGLIYLLERYEIVRGKYNEIAAAQDWLKEEIKQWLPEVELTHNAAKQLAEKSAGKTAIIYAGPLMAPVAYKWKISFNENAKNIAFCNYYSEFNHNEIMGWVSHPVEKPFVIFNLLSGFEHPRILKRFEITEKLLSGRWPHPIDIELKGDSMIKQLLFGSVLADFVGIYLAILNGIDPTQVEVLEKLKAELK